MNSSHAITHTVFRFVVLFAGAFASGKLEADEREPIKMTESSPTPSSAWRQWPSYPRARGVAGALVGRDGGMMIAAGGANFPDAPPWEGGAKKTYDDIHVFSFQDQMWRPAGALPAARAYAAVVSTPAGVLICGGENADRVFQDTLWLRWNGKQVIATPGPELPAATTSSSAVALDDRVFLVAGYGSGNPRTSQRGFWSLDLKDPKAQWVVLPPCPGPSRGQAVMAALDGAVYLFSGIELIVGKEGKPQVTYLTDAYRYRPNDGWAKLPDLPRSSIAAPSPAPISTAQGRIFIMGGVDGRLVGKQPRDTRVPDDIIYFDLQSQAWKAWPERWPDPVVNVTTVQWAGEWLLVSGETMSGQRTPHVWSWAPDGKAAMNK